MIEIGVDFPIEIEEDGWPPLAVESLRAIFSAPNRARIDNTPFFAKRVALGDVVSVIGNGHNGKFTLDKIIESSGNSSIAIILRDHGCKQQLVEYFSVANCFCEFGEFGATKMLAASVPSIRSYFDIFIFLTRLEERGQISFAELCLAHGSSVPDGSK